MYAHMQNRICTIIDVFVYECMCVCVRVCWYVHIWRVDMYMYGENVYMCLVNDITCLLHVKQDEEEAEKLKQERIEAYNRKKASS